MICHFLLDVLKSFLPWVLHLELAPTCFAQHWDDDLAMSLGAPIVSERSSCPVGAGQEEHRAASRRRKVDLNEEEEEEEEEGGGDDEV